VTAPAQDVSAGRGITAVLGAVLLFALASRILEQTLGNPAITAVLNVAVAFLVGYIGAKIAGAQEVMVLGVAATIETCMLAYGWMVGAYDALPIWIRTLLVLTTGPGMVAGAWVRMQARLAARASQ
jgi:hypothetical protein